MTTVHVFAGGGVRGIGSLVLAEKLAFQPDMICGTSTGSIIAAARAIGYSYSEIKNLYLEHVKTIFKPNYVGFGGMFAPKYKAKNLEKVIRFIFSNRTNKDCEKCLMINAYNITQDKPKYWKSWDNEEWSVADAVIASCSAPTYFVPHKIKDCQFVDGGMESNCIADSALIEAIGRKGGEVDLVVFGTGIYNEKTKIKNGGIIDWNTKIIDIMLEANNNSSVYKAKEIINLRGNIDTMQIEDFVLTENVKLDDLNFIRQFR